MPSKSRKRSFEPSPDDGSETKKVRKLSENGEKIRQPLTEITSQVIEDDGEKDDSPAAVKTDGVENVDSAETNLESQSLENKCSENKIEIDSAGQSCKLTEEIEAAKTEGIEEKESAEGEKVDDTKTSGSTVRNIQDEESNLHEDSKKGSESEFKKKIDHNEPVCADESKEGSESAVKMEVETDSKEAVCSDTNNQGSESAIKIEVEIDSKEPVHSDKNNQGSESAAKIEEETDSKEAVCSDKNNLDEGTESSKDKKESETVHKIEDGSIKKDKKSPKDKKKETNSPSSTKSTKEESKPKSNTTSVHSFFG